MSDISLSYEITFVKNAEQPPSGTAASSQNNNASNGYIIVAPSTGWMWLKNSKKETLRKGVISGDLMADIQAYKTIKTAGFIISITREVKKTVDTTKGRTANAITNSSGNSTNIETLAILKKQRIAGSSSSNSRQLLTESMLMREEKRHSEPVNFTSTSTCTSTASSSVPSSSDNELLSAMQPHQFIGAKYLLDRLSGKPFKVLDSSSIEIDPCIQDVKLDASLMTGAILADEMGTGKTLTSLSVLWSLCQYGKCKGIVVCPSSLVGNWEIEIKKWLSKSFAVTALYIKSSTLTGKNSPDSIVHRFITSHPSIHPILVISYEMFRSFADALNTLHTLEVLICDEGHRLKNALGTKTTIALGNCIATKRLVLTGTPIQNNLDELYAVVNFVNPGYLGSLEEFKAKYVDPISIGTDSGASDIEKRLCQNAASILREYMSLIMIRRTRAMISSTSTSSLPMKSTYLVMCTLSPAQRQQYLAECSVIFDIVGIKDKAIDSDGRSDGATAAGDDDGNDEGKSNGAISSILSNLMKLRQISNNALSASTSSDVKAILSNSGKLTSLFSLLSTIKAKTDDKVVIVSNFTSVLDAIQKIVKHNNWPALRLDGSTPTHNRISLVNRFNENPYFLMLLSAKAGGVGLNLIGANRLFLVDPDWNPATDSQAMGRVHREGQKKVVYIYRLISTGTVEESIIKRQNDKGVLATLIQDEGVDADAAITSSSTGNGNMLSGITKNSLKQLILPTASTHTSILPSSVAATSSTTASSVSVDELSVDTGDAILNNIRSTVSTISRIEKSMNE